MPYSQDVKEIAYTIDPTCWVSYSGKGRHFKAVMDERRVASLRKAQEQVNRVKRKKKPVTLSDFSTLVSEIDELERRAHEIGAHVTGHALNRAKNACGWEMAGDIEQAGKAATKPS